MGIPALRRSRQKSGRVKGTCYTPGLTLRRGLLIKAGIPTSVVQAAPPKGAGIDDMLTAHKACILRRSMLVTLSRKGSGKARMPQMTSASRACLATRQDGEESGREAV